MKKGQVIKVVYNQELREAIEVALEYVFEYISNIEGLSYNVPVKLDLYIEDVEKLYDNNVVYIEEISSSIHVVYSEGNYYVIHEMLIETL